MTANATHPGRITIPGTDIGVRGTLVAEPQTENELLSLSDRLALGPVKVDTDHDGVLQGTGLVVPIVTGVLWLLRFEPHNNDVPAFSLGVYNLNTSGVDLKDLVETVPTAIDATALNHILDLEAELATFTTANDAVVAPLFNTATATRGNADKVYRRGISVKDPLYGATGNGTTDDSAAIRDAVAAATAAGTTTYFPEGTYIVSEEGTTLGCLNLPSGAWLTGPGTIKVATGQRAGVRPIQNQGVSNIRIDGLTIDMTDGGGVGAHCIQNRDSDHIYINKVKCLTGTRGGISIMGSMSVVRITECEIYSPTFNGITFYGNNTPTVYPLAAEDIVIDKCHIEAGVQPIDSEPMAGHSTSVRITNSHLETTSDNFAITMCGPDKTQMNEGWEVIGNTIIGAVDAHWVKDSVISGNLIDARGSTSWSAVRDYYASSAVKVTGNTIYAASGVAGVELNQPSTGSPPEKPTDWTISNNTIYVTGSTAVGIDVGGAGSAVVSGNTVRGVNSQVGIRARSLGLYPTESVTITGNDVDGFARGIYGIYFAQWIERLVITGNSIDNSQGTPTVTAGIALSGTNAQILQCVIADNAIDPVYGANAYVLGSMLVRSGGSPGTWSGTGSPEGVVTANVGAEYRRRDGSAGTVEYRKESGNNTNTGWVAYAASGGGSSLLVSQLRTTQTVTNTTTATVLFTPTVLGAASLVAGTTLFHLHLAGDMDQIASTGGTFDIQMKIAAATSILSVQVAPQTTSGLTGATWEIDLQFYVETLGASGTVSIDGTTLIVSAVAGTKGVTGQQVIAATADLSSGFTLTASAKMSVANAGNTIRAKRGYLRQIA